ncbi:MAG TPA: chromate resistance protein ChrB domain-containing protein, partial [Polyangiales bacterium]
MAEAPPQRPWLLLMHQLPPHPSQLRVKVWRRLAGIGAVALKNAVYVLPRSDSSLEDLQWVRREILDSRGEATIVEAAFVDGLSDAEVEELFRKARNEDYNALSRDARARAKGKSRTLTQDQRRELEAVVVKLERRFEEIRARDFFGASKREAATQLISQLRDRLRSTPAPAPSKQTHYDTTTVRGHTWVTRAGVKVDRIASAWLILRFIDPEARFKFVAAKGYEPEPKELRFDMFDAEFSHEGEDCTFETLYRRFRLRATGLRAVAEIIHDIDLKDEKFNRSEAAGVAMLIDGLTRAHADDDERL